MNDSKTDIDYNTIINEAMSYEEYRELIDRLLAQDKTTGENHSDDYIHYTKMNVHRMDRLDRSIELEEETLTALEELDRDMVWLVLTEAWCGDAAQNVPILAKMADHTDKISLRLILRDQHLDVMDEHLTNGGRSIPKLVALDARRLNEIGAWGPRPQEAQELYMSHRESEEYDHAKAVEDLQKWYAKDRGRALQAEFRELLENWSAESAT